MLPHRAHGAIGLRLGVCNSCFRRRPSMRRRCRPIPAASHMRLWRLTASGEPTFAVFQRCNRKNMGVSIIEKMSRIKPWNHHRNASVHVTAVSEASTVNDLRNQSIAHAHSSRWTALQGRHHSVAMGEASHRQNELPTLCARACGQVRQTQRKNHA